MTVDVEYLPDSLEVYIPEINDTLPLCLNIDFEKDEWIYHKSNFQVSGRIFHSPGSCSHPDIEEMINNGKAISCVANSMCFEVNSLENISILENGYNIHIEYGTTNEYGPHNVVVDNYKVSKTSLDYDSEYIKKNCSENDSFYFSTIPCWYGYTEDDLLETNRILGEIDLDKLHELLLDEKYLELEDSYGVTSELERCYVHTYKICIDNKCKSIEYHETVNNEKPEILERIDSILVKY